MSRLIGAEFSHVGLSRYAGVSTTEKPDHGPTLVFLKKGQRRGFINRRHANVLIMRQPLAIHLLD